MLRSLQTFECFQLLVSCAAFACFSADILCSRFIGLWISDCPAFYSISLSQVDAIGESLWGSCYTSPSLEMADKEIEEYMNKTFLILDDSLTSNP